MKNTPLIPATIAKRAAAVCACLLAAACAPRDHDWLAERRTSATGNQMMLVREHPPTTGFRRLIHQAERHPDIRLFLQMQGLPDFIAESSAENRRYMILYFLQTRQAFACRTRNGRAGAVEFAGPYPVTDREYQLLEGFRRNAEQAAQPPGT